MNFETIHRYVRLARPYIALPPLLAYFIAVAVSQQEWTAFKIIIGSLLVLLMVTAAVLHNEIEDELIDRSNRTKNKLFSTYISMDKLSYISALFYALSLVLGLVGDITAGIAFVALGTLLSWAYSAAPLRFSRRPIASTITMGLCYGALPLLLGLSGGKHGGFFIFWLGVAWTLQRCGISLLKDYKDFSGDKLHNKRTFLVAYGSRITAITSIALGIIGGVLALFILRNNLKFTVFNQESTLLLLGAGLLGLLLYRSKLLNLDTPKSAMLFGNIFNYQNIYDGVLLLCLIRF